MSSPPAAAAFASTATPRTRGSSSTGRQLRSGSSASLPSRAINIQASRRGYRSLVLTRRAKGIFGAEEISLRLERESYDVAVELIPASASIGIDGSPQEPAPFKGRLDYGPHVVEASATDRPRQAWSFEVTCPGRYVFRLQKEPTPVARPLGILPCGPAPKQVAFAPEGGALFVSLLAGDGFDVIDLAAHAASRVSVPGYGKDQGFVEGIFPAGTSTFLLSQMSRDAIHEFSLSEGAAPKYLRSLNSCGEWTKVIAYEPKTRRLAASNWISDDVTILDYDGGRLIERLGGLPTPRGLAWSPDGSHLYIASYGGGGLFRFDASLWRQDGHLPRPGSALRHIVLDASGTTLYVSDMMNREAIEVDAATLSIKRTFRTGSNPNTIALSPNGRILAVSCRGPNNPLGYIERSPAPGEVLLFDLGSGEQVASIEGGAQPTGLDISRDGRLLAFSNFQDANVELYDISALERAAATKAAARR